MQAAGVALQFGIHPLDFLGLGHDDLLVTNATLAVAQEQRRARDEALAKVLAVEIINRYVKARR